MTLFQQTKYKLNISDTLQLLDSVPIDWTTQLCVTSRTGNDLLDGIGSINDYPGFNEQHFGAINNFFTGSDIHRLLSELKHDGLSFGRVRIMRMQPRTAYSYHMDCETRLHFALKTSDQSMMIINDQVFRVPNDGCGYLLDTTQKHTAINCSNDERIHLVIDVLYPVRKIPEFFNTSYIVQDKKLTQYEFDKWLIETKPPTENMRQDFFFIEGDTQ